MKKTILIGAMVAVSMVLLSGCGTLNQMTSSSSSSSIMTKKMPAANTQVQEYQLRINGNDETLIVEMPTENDMPTYWRFLIGDDEKLKIPNENGIFHTEVKVQDLDQDDTDEILFYQYSTGSAGAILLNIFKPVNGELLVLFESEKQAPAHGDNQRFEIKYTGDYQVSFFDKEKKVSATIELNPENYKEGADEYLPNIGTWIDPVSLYDIKDIDGDGRAEIITTQRVIGISHPDTIALFISTFSLNQNVYEVRDYRLVYEEDPSKEIARYEKEE
ncbi:hypothetical protein [Pseudoneobacillus sp. C159]